MHRMREADHIPRFLLPNRMSHLRFWGNRRRSRHPLMANQPRPGNPARAVRVETELWQAAQAAAAARGETVSDVIRRALERYVRRTP